MGMKLIAQVKLLPTEQQANVLRRTIELTNEACNYLSERAWETKTFRQYDLHKLAYYDTRAKFPELSSQIVVRCIARVTDAYKLDRKTKRQFQPLSAIAYDDRILRWYTDERSCVSIWTVNSRNRISFVCGEKQRALLQFRQGQSDLILRNGTFYLHAICEIEEPPADDPDDFLGLDLGVINIAVDSDGTVHSARHVNNVRHRHQRLRRRLQKKGTKSAKRRLKKLSGKEAKFARDTNHCISKQIVAVAQRTGRGIAMENLTGIRTRIRAKRSQRATLHSWSFYQLRQFVVYKSQLIGTRLVFVDPAYTSQTCPVCGYIARSNRPNQSTFSCGQCGFAGLADHIAAENIRRAAVNRPHVSDATSVTVPGTSSRL